MAMALTAAEKQQHYRDKLKAQAQASPEAIEHALLQEVERCRRGELSDAERTALADRLVDRAMSHLWRAHELKRMAENVRTGRL
jgi:hypothetical protein